MRDGGAEDGCRENAGAGFREPENVVGADIEEARDLCQDVNVGQVGPFLPFGDSLWRDLQSVGKVYLLEAVLFSQ